MGPFDFGVSQSRNTNEVQERGFGGGTTLNMRKRDGDAASLGARRSALALVVTGHPIMRRGSPNRCVALRLPGRYPFICVLSKAHVGSVCRSMTIAVVNRPRYVAVGRSNDRLSGFI